MAEQGKRVEVRMGTFACTIEGYDDPISKLKEVMSLVQQMISETPALVDVSADVDNAEVQEALDTRSQPVRVRRDDEPDSMDADVVDPAEPPPASETDGDFTLAARHQPDDVDAEPDLGVHGDTVGPDTGDIIAADYDGEAVPDEYSDDFAPADADLDRTDAPLPDFGDRTDPSRMLSDAPADRSGDADPAPEWEPVQRTEDDEPADLAATHPAAADEPSGAGRRLYGLGRFAAAVARRHKPEEMAPPNAGDRASAAEAPLADVSATYAPDFDPDGAVNIFSDGTPDSDALRLDPDLMPMDDRPDSDGSEHSWSDAQTPDDDRAGEGWRRHTSFPNETVEDFSGRDRPDDEDAPDTLSPAPSQLRADRSANAGRDADDGDLALSGEPVADRYLARGDEDVEPEPAPEPPLELHRDIADTTRTAGRFRNLFGSRTPAAADNGGGFDHTPAAGIHQTGPEQMTETPDFPVSPDPDAAPLRAEPVIEAPDTAEPASDRRVSADIGQAPDSGYNGYDADDDVTNIFAAEPAETAADTAPVTTRDEAGADDDASPDGSARFGALLERLQSRQDDASLPAMGAPGEATTNEQITPEAAGVSVTDLVELSDGATVSDMLAASAAWLTLANGKLRFSRRDVMDVFESIPGDHPKTLEARIKGYGKLVRSGTLVLIGDGQFALAQTERERFENLLA